LVSAADQFWAGVEQFDADERGEGIASRIWLRLLGSLMLLLMRRRRSRAGSAIRST
jgi:hypothetical protein